MKTLIVKKTKNWFYFKHYRKEKQGSTPHFKQFIIIVQSDSLTVSEAFITARLYNIVEGKYEGENTGRGLADIEVRLNKYKAGFVHIKQEKIIMSQDKRTTI